MQQREGAVTFQGSPLTLIGDALEVGDAAPAVTVLGNDLSEVALASYRGKAVVIASVPSLDTPVCDLQTRRFNEEAAGLAGDVEVLTVSMDLPFAQARWCGAAGVDRVTTLSDHRDAAFGTAYGVLIRELRLLARAVFVVDRDGVIRYIQVVPEITDEPDYAGALDAVRELA
ncbi:MAG: redoxin [Planctomycetes bacterium DG_20]|nr:MAG: redoxin [Planctomycetes bacterium DG_20]